MITSSDIYVLIACEESQAECRAFRDLGFNAYSCDIQPCIKNGVPGWHIHEDVTPFLNGCTQFVTQDGVKRHVPRWDLMSLAAPCWRSFVRGLLPTPVRCGGIAAVFSPGRAGVAPCAPPLRPSAHAPFLFALLGGSCRSAGSSSALLCGLGVNQTPRRGTVPPPFGLASLRVVLCLARRWVACGGVLAAARFVAFSVFVCPRFRALR